MARAIKILLASIAIGLLLSIAVAWGSCLRASRGNYAASASLLSIGNQPCTYEFRRYPGLQVAALKPFRPLSLHGLSPDSVRRGLDATAASVPSGQTPLDVPVPLWIGWPGPEDDPFSFWSTAAAGWPAACLVSHSVGAKPTELGAFVFRSADPWPFRRLPLLPYWPGLVIDTGVHGVLAAAILTSLLVVRQRRRHRRGLCPACAYDLRSDFASGCPECGWNRASARDAASKE